MPLPVLLYAVAACLVALGLGDSIAGSRILPGRWGERVCCLGLGAALALLAWYAATPVAAAPMVDAPPRFVVSRLPEAPQAVAVVWAEEANADVRWLEAENRRVVWSEDDEAPAYLALLDADAWQPGQRLRLCRAWHPSPERPAGEPRRCSPDVRPFVQGSLFFPLVP